MAMALSASDLLAMYTLLANSLSGDQSIRKPAESALAQSESRPGFCSCLMILEKLDHILSVCTSVILGGSEDLTEEESSNDNSCSRPQIPSKELKRRQVSLENSVRQNLQTCAALHGESFNSAISRMHPAAFSQLKQALKMP